MVNDSLFSADRYCDVLFSWQAPAQNSPWETPQAVCVLSSLCGKRQATPAQQMLLLTRGPSSRGWWRPAWLGLGRCWTEKPVTSTTAPLQSLSLSHSRRRKVCAECKLVQWNIIVYKTSWLNTRILSLFSNMLMHVLFAPQTTTKQNRASTDPSLTEYTEMNSHTQQLPDYFASLTWCPSDWPLETH